MVKNVVPQLPNGIRIGDKPDGLELTCVRNADRWRPIIETLKVIDSTKTIQIEIANVSKSKIQSIKSSLNLFAKKTGFKPKIRFALHDSILHIWTNR